MRRRPGPLLLAAVALVAGELTGLELAASGEPPAGAALLAAVLLAALAYRASSGGEDRPRCHRSRVAHRRLSVALALLACTSAGLALGLHAGRQSLASCLADLRSDDALEAHGRAARDLGRGTSGGPGRTVRLELRDVRLRVAAADETGEAAVRTCRLRSLLTRVEPPGRRVPAGASVTVRGEWWSYDPPDDTRPRSLRHYGMISGGELVDGGHAVDGGQVVDGGDPIDGGGSDRGTARTDDCASRALRELPQRLRAAASRRLHRLLPRDVGPAAVALTLADRSDLDPRLSRRFADAGLAHLLAISGLHVGILAGGALLLAGLVTGGRRKHAAAAVMVGAYVLWIGAPSAALRAALLFGGWSVGRTRGRPMRAGELLGAAAIVSLLLHPLALVEAGFQLSFAGFGGLMVGGGCARRVLDRLERAGHPPARRIRSIATAVAAGAGAFALTAPFAAAHFERVAPVAILSNFAGVPLVGLSLAALCGTLLLPLPAAQVAAGAATVSLRGLFRVVDFFSGLPIGHGDALPPGPWEWTTFGLLLAATLLFAVGARSRPVVVAAAAGLALWLARPGVQHLRAGDHAVLCTLDVGQGDAAVIRTRRGHWIVLDAGPPGSTGSSGGVASFLRDRGARGIALFVLSHPHMDHMGGAESLFRRFRVGRVLDAGNPVPSGGYAAFLEAVAEEGAEWIPAREAERIRVDEMEMLILGPREASPRWERRPADANEASVAVHVRLGTEFTYVNTGDASMKAEERILRRWRPALLGTVVLKLGHHGSRTSSGMPWLTALDPQIAVISAGRANRYGHPHSVTLARLDSAGVRRTWRTDRHGSMCIQVPENGDWWIRGERDTEGGR